MDNKLLDEPARLAALRRYDLLDTLPEPSFDRITNLVQSVLQVPISAVSLVDTDRQWFKAQRGLYTRQTSRDVSFCAHAIGARDVMVVADALEDDRFAANPLVTGPPHIRSYLGAPLSTPDGYNLGTLCAIDTVPRAFDARHQDVLENLAALVVEAFELRMIAQRDHLTGALTRRGFFAEADRVLQSGQGALLLLDIDHFKAINDTFGHPTGDVVLQSVAETCRSVLGGRGVVGRIGGEEFGVVLNQGDFAMRVAEELRAALETLVIPHTCPLQVTASFGVALASPDVGSGEAWLAQADIGLYAAKRTGRNRCVLNHSA
ncbi:sensor domain-containing diguanylate cyclase [Phenylobacterium sp. J426]|uniref:GGDEF domain-containing protein n=1 Tax=Phenylobacterium sp. J426 TaxID=2898439 RepID=UPI002151B5FB|nr:sensor domain-containing diguanylate cyclase [Phenylobacterium sp. J426]MCR5876705.1 sensor domain-containing diguanylate cyclase [Phenylobacterium sp. J426]